MKDTTGHPSGISGENWRQPLKKTDTLRSTYAGERKSFDALVPASQKKKSIIQSCYRYDKETI